MNKEHEGFMNAVANMRSRLAELASQPVADELRRSCAINGWLDALELRLGFEDFYFMLVDNDIPTVSSLPCDMKSRLKAFHALISRVISSRPLRSNPKPVDSPEWPKMQDEARKLDDALRAVNPNYGQRLAFLPSGEDAY